MHKIVEDSVPPETFPIDLDGSEKGLRNSVEGPVVTAPRIIHAIFRDDCPGVLLVAGMLFPQLFKLFAADIIICTAAGFNVMRFRNDQHALRWRPIWIIVADPWEPNQA